MKCFSNHLKLYKEVSIDNCCMSCMLLSLLYTQAFANQKVMNALGSMLADHCQKVCVYLAAAQ